MANEERDFPTSLQSRQTALSRWDTEGGAGSEGAQEGAISHDVPELTNAELVQLRIRVIALENIVIALLAEASNGQLEVAREMAAYISPRSGSTQHPLTVHAATHMVNLVDRASRFRVESPS